MMLDERHKIACSSVNLLPTLCSGHDVDDPSEPADLYSNDKAQPYESKSNLHCIFLDVGCEDDVETRVLSVQVSWLLM